ncbi:hypothetical protein CEUSTIGMA_g4997.t1 [Chlamydomonas eustigma]|uniref:Golgin subfamily A member 7/ERF4 domain-containing protein n=1 Tax=Chlamydomonas eustigma TaxID=1157962 RepID=A0A250X396_9CHLO|nr:hypothetical protein CEUSTIGMA_g4997.t1 [Chlamydomonas eustigma]|eukprot:GAX77553.1 hypothetical protein CEUSTIGMA_g4997.t1 [Chlamydomonas eustigma]
MGSLAPWSETPLRVIIEFKRSSEGCKRDIKLTHRKDTMPPQLFNRVTPQAFEALMNDCEHLATEHPYLAAANMDCFCQNLAGCCMVLFVGFGCFQGDAGSYEMWLQKVSQVLAVHQPYYAQCGCRLSVESVHGSFWIQIDIVPAMPMPPMMMPAPGFPYPTLPPQKG